MHMQDLRIQKPPQDAPPIARTEVPVYNVVGDSIPIGTCSRCLPFSCFCVELPLWLTSGLEFPDVPIEQKTMVAAPLPVVVRPILPEQTDTESEEEEGSMDIDSRFLRNSAPVDDLD